jgi:hypothetical protein
MTEDELAAAAARGWGGVEVPNAVARRALRDIPGLIAELAAVRGTVRFEDEPAGFLAALQAEKEPEA